MADEVEEKAESSQPIMTVEAAPDLQAEVLAGALPDWDLVPETPFLRRR